MKTPLAWCNLVHNKTHTLAALGGVTFSVVLIFMQLGFLGSVKATATVLYESLDFDLLIRSREYRQLADPRSFPRSRLYQAAAAPTVRSAAPLYLGFHQWRNPSDGTKRRILIMGLNPGDPVFRAAEVKQETPLLTAPEFVLIDRQSRREFGPKNGKKFGDQDVGVETEVARRRVRVVGHFSLGGGFVADGAILTNEQGFGRVQPGWTRDDVSLGLIKLRDPQQAQQAAETIRRALPNDVEVLTRELAIRVELDHWLEEMSIGVIFRLGVAVALVVGAAIVYQVLSSDVHDHLAEYATLKAIGYGNAYLTGLVLQQAVGMALFGFVPALAFSELLYWITRKATNLTIVMTPERVLGVLALSALMCALSGMAAAQKLRSAEPADLY
jgi:putative ABC transport system permease protein